MGEAISPEDGTYGVKGLPRPPNTMRYPGEIPYVKGLPVRKEISSLASSDDPNERKQWTLFVLALERFKSMPVDDKLSYFQIAGIVSVKVLTAGCPTDLWLARVSRGCLGRRAGTKTCTGQED
jgi:tyrosinase